MSGTSSSTSAAIPVPSLQREGAEVTAKEVVCIDQPGMLAAISKSISNAGINISRADVKSTPDRQAVNSFEVMVRTADQLNRV